ncbi:MAG: ZIP family metal transporter [Candidatus Omnitrophica bacterium]|nr:ZIP family metal transporter [Candidatus Omnitrophota bacterium]
MHNFLWALSASVVVSALSLIGILALLFKSKLLEKLLVWLIAFSAGALIGGAFLHLLPETLEQMEQEVVFGYVIVGFVLFFIMERYFHWRHCHEGVCDIHAFTYLNLIGDGIHNFSDGLAIGASFMVSVHFGIITTMAIVFHEIPQEIGDFAVLVYGGMSKARALVFNYISAATCIAGTCIGYYLSSRLQNFSAFLLPVIAGGFIYIAACDLIPELHKQPGLKRASLSVVAFAAGILFIHLTRMAHAH